jgi:hypothetical protein
MVDAIAERVYERLQRAQAHDGVRLLSVPEAARYIGRSATAMRHLVKAGIVPSVRRDHRVFVDRQDLDHWIEMSKTKG